MSALEFVSAFFSPIYLFLFLNLIIGTIFLTSRHPRLAAKSHPTPLARAPSSLIDRVRSINLSLYKFDAHPEATHSVQHYYPGPAREAVDDDGSPPPPSLARARAPSLLDRLRSVDFYHRKFENINPEPHQTHGVNPPALLARAPSTLLDRLKSMNYYYQKFDQSSDPPHETDPSGDTQDAAPLARAPSLLERVRSIKFPSLYDHDHRNEDNNHHLGKDTGNGAMRRIRSESERIGEEHEKGRMTRMRKTASEKTVEEAAGEEEVEVEEINAKADDFIQKFRQQLRLQRLDSIMKYNKELITGTGSGR